MHSRSHLNTVIVALVWAISPLGTSAETKKPIDSDAELPAWVSKRIAVLQPRPEEKRLDEIGWADDIRHALQLAKKHRRPVFLFTHDGRINLGRC
jgi:hypothetical protein